ncbi:MAG: hypothetical protein A2W17_06185, partial [Planctomycetes bacterium RBG_16_41_13]
LAFAIARPYMKETFAGLTQSDTHTIIVLDNSYSMGYKVGQMSSLDLAKKTALQLLENVKFTEQDRASIILMSDEPEFLIEPTNRAEPIKKAIDDVELSYLGTSFPKTAGLIKQAVDKTQNTRKKVYILTDMQRKGFEVDPIRNGSNGAGEKDVAELNALLKDISQKAEVYIVDTGNSEPQNRAVIDVRAENRIVTIKSPTTISLDIYNYTSTDIQNQPVELLIDNEKKETKYVFIPANTKTSISFRYEFLEPGPHSVNVSLENDYLTIDDTRYLTIDVKDSAKVLAVDGEPSEGRYLSGETDYYRLSLSPSESGGQFSLDIKTDLMFTAEGLDEYDYITLANVRDLSADKVERLEKWVKDGGGLFITLGDKVDKKIYNDLLYKNGEGLLPARLIDTGGDERHDNPLHLIETDYDHPVFNAFRQEGRKAALSAVVFYEFYKVDGIPKGEGSEENPNTSTNVLARFDDVDFSPAFIEKRFGDGRIALSTTTLDDEWNLMPGRAPYLVLMNEVGYYLSSRTLAYKNIRIGEIIQIALPNNLYAKQFNLVTPQGGFITLSPSPLPEQQKFILAYPGEKRDDVTPPNGGSDKIKKDTVPSKGVDTAGVYAIQKSGALPSEKPIAYFAVNVNPDEGNLERITPQEIKNRFPDLKCEFIGEGAKTGQGIEIKPPTSGIWKYILYAVLTLLAVESLLAWLFGRGK